MAQTTLVEMQFEEGQILIDRLRIEGIEVTAAAWLKESDSGEWHLYLATPLVGESGATRPAYQRINAVFREMQKEGFGMDPFEKKVIGPHDPIAKDIEVHRGRPGGPPTPFRGSRLGELPVEDAFLYPPPPTPDEAAGMELWESGQIKLRPGIGPAGRCRTVVIDSKKPQLLQDRKYHGVMENPQHLQPGQLEVTWAEGGGLRIIALEIGSVPQQRWWWSQARVIWDEGGCPPPKIQDAILTAMKMK